MLNVVVTPIKIALIHVISSDMTKLFDPKKLLLSVVFLSVIIVNSINRAYVIYFAVPACLVILFLWYKTYKYNSANNMAYLSNKTFAIATFVLLTITFIVSWYHGNF